MLGSVEPSPVDADDQFISIIDNPPEDVQAGTPPWKVAIIDDDSAVHDGTRFALQNFRLNGRGLEFHSAASAAAGRDLLRDQPDVAVILLDVVMESDEAGLDLVDYVRRELSNEAVRIILRTGQPGHAPEQRIVVDYDINDYKAKTELTAEKLFTTMTAALRSYEQLQRQTRMRQGLEVIVGASATLHRARTLREIGETALRQIARLVDSGPSGLFLADTQVTGDLSVVAGEGRYRGIVSTAALEARHPSLARAVDAALVGRGTFCTDGVCVGHVPMSNRNVVMAFDLDHQLCEADETLIAVFLARLATALDNVTLYEALEEANAVLEQKVIERSAALTATNQRLEAQTAELRRVNAFKNELLGIVAHDLKNPLSVIQGRTEILTEILGEAGDRAHHQLRAIRNSADRLAAIIDERLAEVRRDAPEMTLRPRDFDVLALVERIAEANSAHASRKRQTLAISGDTALMVHADEDRIADAVDNLLSNAVKYSPVGSTVGVSVVREGPEAVVRVTDSGPGIAAADRARLFHPFQRLSASPTHGESSTGLGLYSAKRIVDLHGGRIGLERSVEGEGGGSTFFLSLPLAPVPR
ncbi:histidine kinase [Acuticoccus sediminis]|uniref:histidine kinase n=1 Tax=Acuticoccus sediminis TaxID=2184697 RepID=A0A8B2NUQ6_9HYPH|nr:histidine kinase [Acuticoccus sediminis]